MPSVVSTHDNIGSIPMFLKLKSTVREHKAGDIVDFADESVARGLIAAGLAEESNAAEHLNSAIQSKLDAATGALEDRLKETVRSIMDGAKSNGPPSKGVKFDDQGVPFDKVENGTAEADRNAKGTEQRSFTELMQLIYKARHQNDDDAERSHASKRLKAHYVLGVVQNNDNESDKDSASRSFDMADYKSVSRAGTESVGGGSWSGYLVRPEYINSLFQIGMEEQVIEPFALNIPVGQTNTLSYPAIDNYFTPAKGQSAGYGGVQVFRKGEITQRSQGEPKLRNIEFKITDLTGLSYLSRDLIMDNFLAADMIVQNMFGLAMSWKKDYEFINGDGQGKPLGLRRSPALLTVSARGSNGHIVFNDLVAMLALFHQSRLKNAMWIANQTTYADLMAITNASGAYVFQPNNVITQATMPSLIDKTTSNGLRYAAQGTLLGLPIRFTEKLPALGTSGDIMLIDPQSYGVATRQGLEIGVSDQFAWDTDQVVYRFKIRNEGQPLWLGPYVSADSANTKFSPFVQLP